MKKSLRTLSLGMSFLALASACGGCDPSAIDVSNASTIQDSIGTIELVASAETTMEILHDGGGSIIAYASAIDQILDSDLIVMARITGAELAGVEKVDDGSGMGITFFHVLLTVDEVIHASAVAEVAAGDTIKVLLPKPPAASLEECSSEAHVHPTLTQSTRLKNWRRLTERLPSSSDNLAKLSQIWLSV